MVPEHVVRPSVWRNRGLERLNSRADGRCTPLGPDEREVEWHVEFVAVSVVRGPLIPVVDVDLPDGEPIAVVVIEDRPEVSVDAVNVGVTPVVDVLPHVERAHRLEAVQPGAFPVAIGQPFHGKAATDVGAQTLLDVVQQRIRVDLTLSDADKAGASRTFFTKVKEELDIVPAKVQVIEYWQEKAVFDDEGGEQRIAAAPRQPHPLGKCIASVQLLAYILVAKYADALPLYRLEKILARYGGNISRTAMANWIIRLDDVFRPLINLLQDHQRGGDYLQADETRIQVLKEDGKVATSDKWMWLIRGGPPDRPVVLFHYDASRSEAVPSRLLDGFTGVLQTDGYAGYNKVCRDNPITRIGCWDHARRKFVEASKAAPAKKK
mgnify:CR=1 FL=1